MNILEKEHRCDGGLYSEAKSGAESRRIMLLIDTLETGGTERSLLQFCAHLDRSRFVPTVVSLYRGNRLMRNFQEQGIDVRTTELKGKYEFRRASRAIGDLVDQIEPDLIHTMLFRANQVGRWVGLRKKRPVICSLVSVPYDPVRLQCEPQLSYWKHRCIRIIDRFSSRYVDRFHAVSHTVKISYEQTLGIPSNKMSVIPRGRMGSIHGRLSGLQAAELREKYSLPADKKILLNVGRLIPQKDQQSLIKAMRYVVQQEPNALLLIAGDGPLRRELEDEVESSDSACHVRLLGNVDDVERLLLLADCFVFPSISEGLPGTVIEAMMAGCPVVASDIAMLKEMIDDGQTGLLVQQQNPRSLANGILRMLNDTELSKRCATRAREVAVSKYDIGNVVRQMEQLYVDVLDEYERR